MANDNYLYDAYAQGTALRGKPDFHVGTISRNILANQAREDAKKKAKADKLDKLTKLDLSKAAGLYPMWASQYVKANTDFIKQIEKINDEEGIDAAERFVREKTPALQAYNAGLFTNNNTFKDTEKMVAEGKVLEGNMRGMSAAARNPNTADNEWSAMAQEGTPYGYSPMAGYGFSAAPVQREDIQGEIMKGNILYEYSADEKTGAPIEFGGARQQRVSRLGVPAFESVSARAEQIMKNPALFKNYILETRKHLDPSIKQANFDSDPQAQLTELIKYVQSVIPTKEESSWIKAPQPQKETAAERNKEWKVEGNTVSNDKNAWTYSVDEKTGTQTWTFDKTDPVAAESKMRVFTYFDKDVEGKDKRKQIEGIPEGFVDRADGQKPYLVINVPKGEKGEGGYERVEIPYTEENIGTIKNEYGFTPVEVREKLKGKAGAIRSTGGSSYKKEGKTSSGKKVSEVERKTKDDKIAIFDANTKEFLRFK